MAILANGFATPAIKRRTSDARRLSESSILAKISFKHAMFFNDFVMRTAAGQGAE